ncbi:MAG TPA: RNA-binding cell elongation regulator Jag/EloR [Spirochaetota bacterium]|nr:RNA-binding cell elongation regulator Jag/EloR [Spirochaetota bacterium]
MTTKEFSGKTEQEIIDLAVENLKLKQEDLEFEFETKKDGIFPFSKKLLTAKVTFDEELQFGNRCLILVRDLLEKMNIEAKIYLIEDNDDKIVIEIESPDSAIIIGKQGKTLESIQTIVNVIMNKNAKEWTKIVIDIGDYRNRRERYLNKMAQNYASQVKKTRKPVLLEPMNPFERRIIHMALKNEKDIETQSEGEGTLKQIKIFIKQSGE